MALQETFEKQGNWLFKNRGYMPFIIIVPGILWYSYLLFNKQIFVNDWRLDFLFLCIGFAGLAVRIFTVGFTPKGTSGRNTSEGQIAEQLNTSGIYSIVRHPLYLGNFLMWLAPMLVLAAADVWFALFTCAFFWIYYEKIMYAEEQFLRKKFGQSYIDWANKTPAFFPKFSQYRKSNLTFSLKNALKREHNGFFNLVLIMTLFRVIGYAITTRKFYLDTPWIIIFSTTFVIFVLLRIIKKCTKILEVEGR
jgi:protein-S-isoprenylcysteine O-methyltransferase Ste14